MRLVSFQSGDGPRIGFVKGDAVIDLTSVNVSAPRDIQQVITEGLLDELSAFAARESKADQLALNDLVFNMPIRAPGKILCLGLNYIEHVNEGIFEQQPFPTIFMRSVTSMTAHNAPLIRPSVSETLDFEAELALIVGKQPRHLTPANALEVVAGYSCANDGSVREYQRHTIQWTMGKNFDDTGPFGPCSCPLMNFLPGPRGLIFNAVSMARQFSQATRT